MLSSIAWLFVFYSLGIIMAGMDQEKRAPLMLAWLGGGFFLFTFLVVPIVFIIVYIIDFKFITEQWWFALDKLVRSVKSGTITMYSRASLLEQIFTVILFIWAFISVCFSVVLAGLMVQIYFDKSSAEGD